MNSLVYELAVVAAREKATLDECEALLASMAAMQVNVFYQIGWHRLSSIAMV